jgi:GTP-binding protein EngB required for normal cell division
MIASETRNSRFAAGKERGLTSNEQALELVTELAARYQLTSIRPLLEICQKARQDTTLSVAVLGRFKAGKSSFLNHLIGLDVLPVGVVPVTSVVTEVAYGPKDGAVVHFGDGREVEIGLPEVRQYVSELENPLNRKRVASVSARLSTLSTWRDLRFIDTPGLESAFAHNSEASLGWAPNVDVALVAIGVDPPLSEHDIELIRTLFRYTPRIAVLLTKADVMDAAQLREVIDYIQGQLRAKFDQEIPIYPYSTRPGFEPLKNNLENQFLRQVVIDIGFQRREISERKLVTLLRDCEQYIALTLKSAEMLDTERATLQKQLSAEETSLADTRLEIQLIARHALAGTRTAIEKALAPTENPIRQKILGAFDESSHQLPTSFARLIEAFSDWLHDELANELVAVSGTKRQEFVRPLADVQRQYQRVLQNFRDRLSDRTFTLFGVPLKTTEPEIVPEPPKAPDVNIGRAFDHSWELLSPLLPMNLLRGAVFSRFRRKIADETFKNLSRLTTQWENIVTSAILGLQREAEKRLVDLLTTVQMLVSASSEGSPEIKRDLARLQALAGTKPTTEGIEHHP